MARNKKSKPSVVMVCNTCGKPVKKYVSQLHGDIVYCGDSCYREAKKNGVSNPKPKDTKFEALWNCAFCGKEIMSMPSRVKKYCSLECSARSKTKPLVDCLCLHCGKSFQTTGYKLKIGHGKYCSVECWGMAGRDYFKKPMSVEQKDKIRDSNTKTKRAGKIFTDRELRRLLRKGARYRDWRNWVFGVDDFTCVRCGKRGGYLHAHHIDSFADNPDFRFDPDNGVAMCEDCHHFVHTKEFLADVETYAIGVVVRGDHVGLY